YDLYRGEKHGRISSNSGYTACLNVGETLRQGNYGAGTGAVSGGLKGGLGSASEVTESGACVGALAAVNSAGYTCDPSLGGFYARGIELENEYGCLKHLPIDLSVSYPSRGASDECTVLGVVATDVGLSRVELTKVAQMAQDGVARAIRPAHTMFDGDTVFAISTGRLEVGCDRAGLVSCIGHIAADAVSRSIMHGVLSAESVNGIESYGEKYGMHAFIQNKD
ncbi:peptidase S58 family protein, partial [Candidatus Bathyarchaeota archaeon]|nr:peptidase S58 family protein [Candidatus Bathyarchaeota archaeon]